MELKARAHNSELESYVRSKKLLLWLEILRVTYLIVRDGIKFIFVWDPQILWRISHYIFWCSNIRQTQVCLWQYRKIEPKLITNVVTRQYSLDLGRHSIQGNTRSCTTLHRLAMPRTTEMRNRRSESDAMQHQWSTFSGIHSISSSR